MTDKEIPECDCLPTGEEQETDEEDLYLDDNEPEDDYLK